jgi:diguanylate cyclase (GGDEF)-like protein
VTAPAARAPRRWSSGFTRAAPRTPIWSAPDPALAAAGIEGEHVVATVRLIAMALLIISPTISLVSTRGQDPMHVAGFTITLLAAGASVAIWARLRNGDWHPWIGFASSTFDISMVSLALASFYVVASPLSAINSTVTFEMYFLALVATSLRYDARICIVVGVLAVLQYGTLWAVAAFNHDLTALEFVMRAGPYIPVDLFTRLILLGIATLLSVSIVRRAQRLLYLASRDRLTGLYNRGHFDRALVSAMDQATRDKTPLTLTLLDVDHFKQINDRHGHAIGDRVLEQVADLMARSMRKTDIVARYGGEEFVIILPNTTRDAAYHRIEALRREISDFPLQVGAHEVLRINFSAGVAGTIADPEIADPKVLVDVADRRLLAAKRAGRGRVFASEEDVSAALESGSVNPEVAQATRRPSR